MILQVGAKLVSAVCSAQGIVIRAPAGDGSLTCGGRPMRLAAQIPGDEDQLADAETGAPLLGKRYVDASSGLELLCTKGGKGALAFDGRPLTFKDAKPLPASD